MKMWKKMAVVAMAAIATAMPASAQDDEGAVESYVDVDFVSHYMWRGQDKGGVSIQPEAYISWQGLTLKLDGSTGFESSDIKQVNVTLGYEIAGFNVGVIDRWVSGLDLNDRYFNFDKRGAHQLEANLGFSWKYGSLQAYTIFWGNDYRISGEHAYSTYVEFSVPFKLGGVNWKASVGGTPFESAGYTELVEVPTLLGTELHKVANYSYAEGPACIMASLRATKTIDLGFAHVPVFAELHTNPYLQKATFLCGLTIAPF